MPFIFNLYIYDPNFKKHPNEKFCIICDVPLLRHDLKCPNQQRASHLNCIQK